MHKKREFRIQGPQPRNIPYNGIVDKHLEYFFANRTNRHILVKSKIVNRKNEIIDKDLCRMVDGGFLNINNKFRMKKAKPKNEDRRAYQSIQSKSIHNRTVGKKEFQLFLESQRNQIKNKTIAVRYSSGCIDGTEEHPEQQPFKQ